MANTRKTPDKEESKAPIDRTDLTRLKEDLKRLGAKEVPHPGTVKVRIYPEPKRDK